MSCIHNFIKILFSHVPDLIALPDFLKALVVRIYYPKARKEQNKPKDFSTYKAKTANLRLDEIYTKFLARIALPNSIITLIIKPLQTP